MEAIKLKLYVTKKPHDDILFTRKITQQIGQVMQNILLEMRQQDVCIEHLEEGTDKILPGDDWKHKLLKRVGSGNASQLSTIRQYYERIIRTASGVETSDAATNRDAANTFGPMFQLHSKGGHAYLALLESLRPHLDDDDTGWCEHVRQLEAKYPEMFRLQGAKSVWLRLRETEQAQADSSKMQELAAKTRGTGPKKKPAYPEAFAILNGQKLEKDPNSWPLKLRAELREAQKKLSAQGVLQKAGVLPIQVDDMPPVWKDMPVTWRKMIWAQVIGNLNAYETGNRNTQENKKKAEDALAKWDKDYFPTHQDAIKVLQSYEEAQHQRLTREGIPPKYGRYLTSHRESKNMEKMAKWLQRNPNASDQEKRTQGRKFWKWGEFAEFMIGCDYFYVAGNEKKIRKVIERNALQMKMEKLHSHAKLALDRVWHPRYDAPPNTNNPQYRIREDLKTVEIPLLTKAGEERKATLQISPSEQLRNATVPDGKEFRVVWNEKTARIKGALLKCRSKGNKLQAELCISIDPEGQDEKLANNLKVAKWLQLSPSQRAQKTKKLLEGLDGRKSVRIAALDLGCERDGLVVYDVPIVDNDGSVVTDPKPQRRFQGIVRLHKATAQDRKLRAKAYKQLYDIRGQIKRLRQIRELYLLDNVSERQKLAKELNLDLSPKSTTWKKDVGDIYQDESKSIGDTMSHLSIVPPNGAMGESFWGVIFWDKLLRLLKSWTKCTPPWSETSPHGSVHKELYKHLNNKKKKIREGRVAKLTEVLVDKKVDILILENLESYTTSITKTRRENNRLKLWAPQETMGLITRKLGYHGICTCKAPAQYTSRFVVSGSPGIRCRAVTKDDVERVRNEPESGFAKRLKKDGIDLSKLCCGHFIPYKGGDHIVGIDGCVMDAEINAAQNLLEWFVGAYQSPVYVTASPITKKDGSKCYVRVLEESPQDRCLRDWGDSKILMWDPVGDKTWKLTTAKKSKSLLAQLGLKEWDDDLPPRKTLVRDPIGTSGILNGLWTDDHGKFWSEVKGRSLTFLRCG